MLSAKQLSGGVFFEVMSQGLYDLRAALCAFGYDRR